MVSESAYAENAVGAALLTEQKATFDVEEFFARQAPAASVLRRERIGRRLLAIADMTAVLVTLAATALLTKAEFSWVELGFPILLVVLAKVRGLYDRDDLVIRKSTLVEVPKLFELAAIATALEYLVHRDVIQLPFAETPFIGLFLLCLSLALAFCRAGARHVAGNIVGNERCFIVGSDRTCGLLTDLVTAQHRVDVIGTARLEDVVTSNRTIDELIAQVDAHRLVIAPNNLISEETTLELIKHAKLAGVPVSIFPTVWAAIGGSAVFDELEGSMLLGIPRFGLTRSSERIKRAFDLIVAGIATIALAPCFALIAIVIKLDSPGPVLFRQTRVGRGGHRFSMLKFRSMVVGADAMKGELLSLNEAGEGLFKIANDPRMTRVGRFLRRLHLDELPQLFNVLRGEMSLVGPRPLVEEEDCLFAGGDRSRLRLTPGITGPWQVRGPMTTPLAEMAKLDYLYIANWTLWQDILILLRTAGRVFDRGGH